MKALENEKNHLNGKLTDSQASLDKTKNELATYQSRLSRLMDILSNENQINEVNESDPPEVCLLKQILKKQFNESSLGVLQHKMNILENQLREYEERSKYLQNDIQILNSIAEEAQASLCVTQDDLASISEELAGLYHHVCHVNGETPNRVLLDHAASGEPSSLSYSSVSSHASLSLRLDQLREKLKSNTLLVNWKTGNNSIEVNRTLETLRDQIRHLKRALDATLEIKSQRSKLNDSGVGVSTSTSQALNTSVTDASLASLDAEELQEQVVKLKSLLSTKREQIATLRTVLKANKQTAEVALANLKSKYETEKAVVTETMAKLRNELKALKEDAATFASLRSMFAARCEEYVAQNDELQRQLQASEEEKKTLNSLLRIAIQQKLSLTQKLEDLEVDRERNTLSSPRIAKSDRTPRGGGRGVGSRGPFRPFTARNSIPVTSTPQASPAHSSSSRYSHSNTQSSSSSANDSKSWGSLDTNSDREYFYNKKRTRLRKQKRLPPNAIIKNVINRIVPSYQRGNKDYCCYRA